jgi:hypothetical protein
MFNSLSEIRGIGKKVREIIIEHYGSEEKALEALSKLDFHGLVSALPPQKALEIAREVYSHVNRFRYLVLLMTPEARAIYHEILDTLKEYAHTRYGKLRLGLFYPTDDLQEIQRRHSYVAKGIHLLEKIGGDELRRIREALREIESELDVPREKISAVVVTEDKEVYEKLLEKSDGVVDVFLLESPEDLQYLVEYKHVRYLQTPGSRYTAQIEELPRVDVFVSDIIEDLMPEAVLSYFIKHRKQISAGRVIIESLGSEIFESLGLEIDVDSYLDVALKVESLVEGSAGSQELARYSRAYDAFHEVVEEVASKVNRDIAEKIEKEASIHGRDILTMLEREDVYSSLPSQILEILEEGARKCEAETARRLEMEKDSLMFAGLFSAKYPIELREERYVELWRWLEDRKIEEEFQLKRKLAAELSGKRDLVSETLVKLLELDVLLSLGEFSRDYRATFPKFAPSLSFKEARHLGLQKMERRGELTVQPVSYSLDKICVLTGANSGGKTTLLETIAQIQIMSQCGLPVFAREANVPMIQELYYFKKRLDSTGAGAFEAILKSFASLSKSGEGKRLILADEIESITEPGAASKIIAAILEWFAGDDSTWIVLVTHLGEGLLGMPGVRIDGIEAAGLDEDLNLIVDRNPRINRLARSTPELILERLSKKEEQADFYRYLLEKFKKHNP